MNTKQVLKVRRYKAGYEVRDELIDGKQYGGKDMVMKSAYTPEGHYIGNPKDARRLVIERGIKPEPRAPDRSESNGGRGRTCSIGYCERDGKWYGYSHRAIYGFGIGDKVKKGDCTAEYLPIGFTAKTLDDCKKMAEAFAESVS